MDTLKFSKLQGSIDVSFWSELGSRKLDTYKLSEAPINIRGYYTASRYSEVPSQLQADGSCFDASAPPRMSAHAIPGCLINLNTLDSFQSSDKAQILKEAALKVWADICSGAAEQDPSRLVRFVLLTHGDLKYFHYHYWFAFPALKPAAPFLGSSMPLAQALGASAAAQVLALCDTWRTSSHTPSATSSMQPDSSDTEPTDSSGNSSAAVKHPAAPFWLLVSSSATFDQDLSAQSLADWHQLQQQHQQHTAGTGQPDVHVMVAMADPNNLPLVPSWPLRNLLVLAVARWGVPSLKVVCVRDVRGRGDPSRSLLVSVDLASAWHGQQPPPAWLQLRGSVPAAGDAATIPDANSLPPVPDAVGWEPNEKGQLLPRFLDLSPMMSPTSLAEQAVDLNLRLMRWRAAPALDIGRIGAAKCLLLGAGTLGCAVARTLMAWGVRHITFIDSGNVSYSNPVRQSLFTFEDCLEGGKPKAHAAAERLRLVFPSVVTGGHALSIPMPGHAPKGPQDTVKQQEDAAALDVLVAEHDAVFLLTDTRESRWLPSLLAARYGKVAITAAVGFDSFVVMRHGGPPTRPHIAGPSATSPMSGSVAAEAAAEAAASMAEPQSYVADVKACIAAAASGTRATASVSAPVITSQPPRLGCYFCNDVVAPLNSTRDRALDQQCTVARPGLAPIAGAVAVELLAALLQHPLGVNAPPPSATASTSAGWNAGSSTNNGDAGAALGPVPHMVRGQLTGFSQVCMEGQAFSQCTACSHTVVERYKRDGWALINEALVAPSSLEELTGLAQLHRDAAAMFDLDSSDSEDNAAAAGTTDLAAGDEVPSLEKAAIDDWTSL